MRKAQDARRLFRFLRTSPAVEGQRVAAFRRALAWQLAKARGAPRALVTVGPARLFCYPGSTSASGVLYVGLPEWDEMTFLLRYLRPGDHFVDVGANIGVYTVLATTSVAGVTATAIEPDALARRRLEENLSLNGVEREVRTVGEVIGAEPGTVGFTSGRDTVNQVSVEPQEDSLLLQMTTLDDVLDGTTPALMKIDVEGLELDVLRGAPETLGGDGPGALIIEANGACERFDVTPAMLRSHLDSFGYELFEYFAATGRLLSWDGQGYPPGGNLIAAKSATETLDRLQTPVTSLDPSALRIQASIEYGRSS